MTRAERRAAVLAAVPFVRAYAGRGTEPAAVLEAVAERVVVRAECLVHATASVRGGRCHCHDCDVDAAVHAVAPLPLPYAIACYTGQAIKAMAAGDADLAARCAERAVSYATHAIRIGVRPEEVPDVR